MSMETVRRPMILLLGIFIVLLGSCSTTRYQGSLQVELARYACPITTKQCFLHDENQSIDGTPAVIDGYYSLESNDDGTYSFKGAVRFESEHPAIVRIEHLDLIFVFFSKGVFVAHEEKIRLRGETGRYLEFSRLIKSDVTFVSSEWASLGYRVTE